MQSKGVQRYRPGKLPSYAQAEGPPRASASASAGSSSQRGEPDDRRLRRAKERARAEGTAEAEAEEEEGEGGGKGEAEAEGAPSHHEQGRGGRGEARRRGRREAEVVLVAPKAAPAGPGRSSGASGMRDEGRRPAVAEVVVLKREVKEEEPREDDKGDEGRDGPTGREGQAAQLENEQTEEEERRRRIKERLSAEAEEEELEKEEERPEEEDGADEGDSDEWETDTSESEDEYNSRRPTITPTFVKKEARQTLQEREAQEKEEAEREASEASRKERRKMESRQLFIETVKRESEEASTKEDVGDNEDEEDELDEEEDGEAEYEKWKVRELMRIKRDEEEKAAYQQELAEVEKRRGLSDAEVLRLDADRFVPQEKAKWNYLQKYYHKGAFYQDDPYLRKNDYENAPTLEDRIDRSILPKVLQVKNFGHAGRTKWTHLLNEDTSFTNKPLSKPKPKPRPVTEEEIEQTQDRKWGWSGFSGDGTDPDAAGKEGGTEPPVRTFSEYRDDRFDPYQYTPTLKHKYVKKMGGMGSVDDPFGRKKRKRTQD